MSQIFELGAYPMFPMPPEIIEAAKSGEWELLRRLIQSRVPDFETLRKWDRDDYTILHHACNIEAKDKVKAENCVRIILESLASFEYTPDDLSGFVNKKNKSMKTALYIAVKRGHDAAIEMLLSHSATVDAATMGKISKHHYPLLLNIFDDGTVLKKGSIDDHNEALWTLECNFGVLTGSKFPADNEGDNYRESVQLATILKLDNYTQLIVHPLSQLFIEKKRDLYRNIIRASVVIHGLWAIFSAAFIMCSANDISTKKLDLENTEKFKTAQNISNMTGFDVCDVFRSSYNDETSPFTRFLQIFWIIALVKELAEISLSLRLSTCFYIKQVENWGQGLVVFVAMPIGLFCPSSTLAQWTKDKENLIYLVFIVYLAGGFSSLFLVQSQFTKLKHLGVLIEIIVKGLWKILYLLLAFFPMLLAYLVVFRILMPNHTQYHINWGLGFGKILAGMTGELNYDETFSNESTKDMIDENLTKLVFVFFIVSIVLLFQNILISLTISDIEKLKTKATAENLATTLEMLYLLETFFMSDVVLKILDIFGKKYTHVCRYTLYSSVTSELEGSNETQGCFATTAQIFKGFFTCPQNININNFEDLRANDTMIIKFLDLPTRIQRDVRERLGKAKPFSEDENMQVQKFELDSFQITRRWENLLAENIEAMKKLHSDQLNQLRETVKREIEVAVLNRFPCNSRLCGFCNYKKVCENK